MVDFLVRATRNNMRVSRSRQLRDAVLVIVLAGK